MTFEDLDYIPDNGGTPVRIAEHHDIHDTPQSENVISITTNALDEETQLHAGEAGTEQTVVDRVTYKGLTPGKEYTLKGELIGMTALRNRRG